MSSRLPKGGLALKDVSFHIAKGEFVFLHGHLALVSPRSQAVYADSGYERRSACLGFNVAELRRSDVPMLRRRSAYIQDFRLLEDRPRKGTSPSRSR